MRYLLLVIVILMGCSPKVSSDIYWINQYGEKEFTVPNIAQLEHTAKVRIDYRNTNNAFNSSDFVIINI